MKPGFRSGCGVCRPSTDYVKYYSTGGGVGQYESAVGDKVMIPKGSSNTPPTGPTATQMLSRPYGQKFVNDNLGISWATTGGSKHHKKKKHSRGKKNEVVNMGRKKMVVEKGGLHRHLKVPLTYKFRNSIIERLVKVKNGEKFTFRGNKFVMNDKLKHQLTLAKSFIKMRKDKRLKNKHSHHEGKRHNGQKGGDTNWGATSLPQDFYNPQVLHGYSADSGVGVPTAYGPSDPLDAGVGHLAPFNVADNAPQLTMQQTGGKKKKATKKKTATKKKKATKTTKKKTATKTTKKKKKQKGGDTNWGATGKPQRYYNADMSSEGYSADSGMGVPTAYGPSNPLNASVGNLAPFSVADGVGATMQQTGGKKKKRTKRGGTISDQPVKGIVSGLDSAINSIVTKFNQLDQSMASFDTSMNEMLDQNGGKKHNKKRPSKGHKVKRPSPEESATKHKLGQRKKGGDGHMRKVVKTKTGVKRWQKINNQTNQTNETNKKKRTVNKKVSKKKSSHA